jgi:hypothetical protein
MTAEYITLMSSLPFLGNLFEAKQPPISRLRLESRLKLLEEKDRILLDRIASLIAYSHQSSEQTDAHFVAEAKRFFQEVDSPTLRELVMERLDVRTIMAALRRRRRGENEPPTGQPWGFGRWVDFIERHWAEPSFHLEGTIPWLTEAERLLNDNDSVGVERLLIQINWKILDRVAAGHDFDFEAVVIYLGRWSMVDHWSRYNSDAAVERFRKLVDYGIQEFTEMFA